VESGEDITDWLQKRRGTIEELSKIENEAEDLIDSAQPTLNIVSISEFVKMEISPNEFVVKPWLPKEGLAMIHAERGLGKTYLSLWLAAHIACGQSFLNWQIIHPRKVLYVDGEMSPILMKERLIPLFHSLPELSHYSSHLQFLCANLQTRDKEFPNLATQEGQILLNTHLGGRGGCLFWIASPL